MVITLIRKRLRESNRINIVAWWALIVALSVITIATFQSSIAASATTSKKPSTTSKNPSLLIGIISCQSQKCAAQRQFLRTDSWPSLNLVQYRFFVGSHLNDTLLESTPTLAAEIDSFQDLSILNCDDSHRGLTFKTRALLQWMNQLVTDDPLLAPEFFMKTDDDVFVNVPQLLNWLSSLKKAEKSHAFVAGNFWFDHAVIRKVGMRWADPQFPTDVYPPYPSGPGYLLNREGVRLMASLSLSAFAPTFLNEDTTIGVWMTLLAGSVTRIHDERFWTPNNLIDRGGCDESRFVVHRESAGDDSNIAEQSRVSKLVIDRHCEFTLNMRKCLRMCC